MPLPGRTCFGAASAIHHVALLLVLLIAAALRLWQLDARPMHADEANQAVKLGELLQQGDYHFDPRDHHGPTLYYAALVPAWLRGETTLAALTETTVRLTPAAFGILVVGLVYLLAAPQGRWAALGAAAFVAVSPPAVYYSRYFIQETLLSAFTLAALVGGERWWRTGKTGWAAATGAAVGLMLATKATAPLFALAALAGFFAVRGLPGGARLPPRRVARDVAVAAAVALVLAPLFYSSFLTNLPGLRDGFATLAPTVTRATGGSSGHEKPWWYYASLFLFRREGGYVWDQSLFFALAVAGGAIATRTTNALVRFSGVHTGLVALVLSLAPYKTPWVVVNLVPGLALLAGAALAALGRRPAGRIVALALCAIALTLQTWQVRRAAFVRPADARNPFAYVHSSPDVLKVPALAAAALARHPEGVIKVVGTEYWPLPWYLRQCPNVGYWNEPPADCDGALVIASADRAEAVRARLHDHYREGILGLRPGVLLVVFTPD